MTDTRAALAGAAAGLVLACAHLGFELLTGGIVTHHLLADPDMPGISNAFALLTLPVLGALFGVRLRRVTAVGGSGRVLGSLAAAIVYGGALAVAFEFGADAVAQKLFLALFVLAVLLPLYRIECLAGFVMGMTFTFGAILPVLFGGVVAIASAVLHTLAVLGLRALRSRRRGAASVDEAV